MLSRADQARQAAALCRRRSGQGETVKSLVIRNQGCNGTVVTSRKTQSRVPTIERRRMLVKCTECGSDVSDRAPSCPRCGSPSDAFAKEPSPNLGRNSFDSVNDGARPFDANKYVSKLEWHQTPGYQSLDKITQDVTKKSYANVLIGGALVGFVFAVIISIVANTLFGLKIGNIILYIIPISALGYAGLKYYCIQKVIRINESIGVEFSKPTDNSWRYVAPIITGAIVLNNTMPTDQTLFNAIDYEIERGIADGTISTKDDIGANLVKIGCKIYSKECAKLFHSMLDVRVSDFMVIRIAKIKLGKEESYCSGILNKWFCER